jgi:hypothetical protein
VVPGRYRVRVDDAELDQTRDGKPMINVWLVVQGGEFEGATVIDRLLPQHEKALFRVVGFMQAIGLATPKKRLKLNVRAFVNKVLEVDIEDGEPYNGRVKSEIRGYYRIDRTAPEEGPADVEDELTEADLEAMADEHSGAHLKDEHRQQQLDQSNADALAQAAPVPDDAADDGTGYEPIDLEDIDLS